MTLGTSALITALSVITGIIIARSLGPAGRGQLTAVLLWPGVLVTIGSLGCFEAVTYYTAKEPSRSKRICATALQLAGAQSILIIALGYPLMPLVLGHYGQMAVTGARLFLLYAPLYLLTFVAAGVLRGRLRMTAYNAVRITVIAATALGLVVLFTVHQLSLMPIVGVYLAAYPLTLGLALALLAASGDLGLRPDRRLFKPLFLYGLKSHAGNLSVLANERADQMMVSLFLAPVSLGLYAIAVSLSSLVAFIGTSIGMVALPAIGGRVEPERRANLARFVRVTVALSALAAVLEIIMVPVLIKVFFGRAFLGATGPAQILLLAAIFASCNLVLSAGLNAFNRPLIPSLAQIFALVVTAASLGLLLPRFGITGAAVASLLSYGAATVSMVAYISRRLHIRLISLIASPADVLWIWARYRGSAGALR